MGWFWLGAVGLVLGSACSVSLDETRVECPLSLGLSTIFARRTALWHVCGLGSARSCLALLLIDQHALLPSGWMKDTVDAAEETTETETEWRLKDHPDLGFLPRIARREFVRLRHVVASKALAVHGHPNELVLLPSLDGRAGLNVTFDADGDRFIVHISRTDHPSA